MSGFRFCPLCGGNLSERNSGGLPRMACDCGFVHWRNPAPATAVVLLHAGRCLWVRRANEPFRGAWSLPSGFLEWDEDVEAGALRETKEETGLDVELTGVLGVYSCFDDPRGHSLLVVYTGRLLGGSEGAGDDADALGWYPLHTQPDEIAWEAHARALADLRESPRVGPVD